MLVGLALALRKYREHRSPVGDEADLWASVQTEPKVGTNFVVAVTTNDTELNQLRLEPTPVRLAPYDDIVVDIHTVHVLAKMTTVGMTLTPRETRAYLAEHTLMQVGIPLSGAWCPPELTTSAGLPY